MRKVASDRLAVLQAVRFVAGAATALTLLAVPELRSSQWPAVPALLGWLVLTSIAEALRRTRGWQLLLTAMLGIDVLVLGALLARTGGYRSPLMGLVYLHVVAVSLLLSHRIAMRVAVLHGLALISSFMLAASGRWKQLQLPVGTSAADGARVAAVHAGAFLGVAVAVMVFSAMNERVVQRAHREIALLADLGKALGGTATLNGGLAVAAKLLMLGLEAEAVAVAVTDGATCRAATVDATACRFIDASGEIAMVIGALPHTDLVHHLPDADAALDVLLPAATNVVVAPFPVGGVLLVAFGGGRRRQLPASTVAVVEQAGCLVASAAERARLNAELERLATTDALTGLPNRRVFEEAFHREIERARRTGERFSLVVLDIDHFKRVNDEHGHDTGDAVLRHFGQQLAAAAREADLPARFGGEEFVVLLSNCDEHAAAAAADRLRRAAVAGDAPLAISASAGVATFGVNAHDEAGLFAAADTALYDAKRSGRDRTCAAAPARRRLVAVAS